LAEVVPVVIGVTCALAGAVGVAGDLTGGVVAQVFGFAQGVGDGGGQSAAAG